MSLKRKSKTNISKIIQNHTNLCLILFLFLLPLSYQLEKDSSAKQISKVNLLLPICQKTLCNQVYAKLIAYNGCFDWRTDDQNLVQLEKIQKPTDPPSCFSEVYVYTKSKSVKEITYVSAKDRYSNEIFKCKVGFSEVKSISIENNFDSINIGDIFELHVLAHDEKGNIFSSLEGWKFNWKIISGHNNAQLIKLTEHGKIEMGDKREKIEKEGYHSDKMLIKGSQTGKILVNVEIVEENLKTKILSNQRELYVIEPFKIIPDKELYIIPNTQYNFDLMYIHSKKNYTK
jgi:nuclear pore complex protein Nup210